MNTLMLLNTITSAKEVKLLSLKQLDQLATEIRALVISNAEKNGGHLGAALGVVELTIALHYVFNSPEDKIIWDIGHQAHVHKIITGRKNFLPSIGKHKGISGFCSREESEHDIFGAGHSSTSIAAALGIAVGQKMKKKKGEVIAVIGDGAITAGMAAEALSNAGAMKQRMFVILNDNEMSISPSVGGIIEHLKQIKKETKEVTEGEAGKAITVAISDCGKANGNIFQNYGCGYIGTIDGHNIGTMIEIFKELKESEAQIPVVLHIKTEKGKGYKDAENDPSNMHSLERIPDKQQGTDPIEREPEVRIEECFTQAMLSLMSKDENVACITAAMAIGTGLSPVERKFPTRVFDVAIGEQCGVTFAAGMAISGMKPYCCLYSTFLQRAYDQVIHDVAIQSLPVRFVVGRGGYVGQDGQTHHGAFDMACLRILPNIVIMSPGDAVDLIEMLNLMNTINNRPSVIRYGRKQDGCITRESLNQIDASKMGLAQLGQSKIVQEGREVCIIAIGSTVKNAVQAARTLETRYGVKPTVVNARFLKPFDTNTLRRLASIHRHIITVEDGSIGGMASTVNEELVRAGLRPKVTNLCHPDMFMQQGSISQQQQMGRIDSQAIIDAALEA